MKRLECFYRYFVSHRRTVRVVALFNAFLLGLVLVVFRYLQLERRVLTTDKDSLLEVGSWPQPDDEAFDLLESITDTFLDHDIKALSSDEMEGRGVGTRGEKKSAHFIASAFQDALLRGAFSSKEFHPDAFYQQVPLQGFQVVNESFVSFLKDFQNNSFQLVQGVSCSLTTDLNDTDIVEVPWSSKLVFGGYCIYAPEAPWFWDDYGTNSVVNKIVLCLVNQPASFYKRDGGLTYYGRWSYKLEELRRRGALGVLLLHTDESAGYGWNVIQSQSKSENIRLRYIEKNASPLRVYGWLSSVAWDELATTGTVPFVEELKGVAQMEGFQCSEDYLFNLSFYARFQVRRRLLNGWNIGALLKSQPGESLDNHTGSLVVVTSHYDHLGMVNSSTDNDATNKFIFHGALDNASGVAKLLVLARTFGYLRRVGKCCKRSILFLSPTAEEAVLLGSSFYVDHPIVPLNQTIACINFDGMNVWGRTKDAVALGASWSTLGYLFQQVASYENLTVAEDPEPHLGHLYRSDQFPFLQRGVPSLKLTHGKIFQGHENDDYFARVVGDYLKNRYHQVTDDYEYIHQQKEPYVGALQELRIAFRLLFAVAQSEHYKPYITTPQTAVRTNVC